MADELRGDENAAKPLSASASDSSNMNTLLHQILLLATVLCSVAAAAETAAGTDKYATKSVANATVDMQNTTETLVHRLTQQLGNATDPNERAALCHALGETHSRDAVEPLIKNLALSVHVDAEKPSLLLGCPAVGALASIGLQAFPGLADAIAGSNDPEIRRRAALAIGLAFTNACTFREAQKLAQTYLSLTADAAADGVGKQRLLQAAKLFEGRAFIAPMPGQGIEK